MDPEVLKERTAKYGRLAAVMLQSVKTTLSEQWAWSDEVSWSSMITTFFAAVFLFAVSEAYWVDFVVINTPSAFVHITMNLDFHLHDSLQLPRICKKCFQDSCTTLIVTDWKRVISPMRFSLLEHEIL